MRIEQRLDDLDHPGVGVLSGADLHPGDERRRVGEVHREEPARVLEGPGQHAHGDRRGVRGHDRVGAAGGLDATKHVALEVGILGHGLLDEVGVADRLLDRGGGVERLAQPVRAARGEEPVALEDPALLEQPVEVAPGGVGVGVGQLNVEAGQREGLGDPAAHVARPDDGDPLDRAHMAHRGSTFLR
jgi:hypothetical protein